MMGTYADGEIQGQCDRREVYGREGKSRAGDKVLSVSDGSEQDGPGC